MESLSVVIGFLHLQWGFLSLILSLVVMMIFPHERAAVENKARMYMYQYLINIARNLNRW